MKSGSALLLAGLIAASTTAGAGPSFDMVVSSGDSWWMGNAWLPVDTPGSIRDSVQMWADVLNVRRIYWRGQQEEMMIDFGLIRKENLQYHQFFEVWERHLMKDLHLNQVFNQEAHRHGMEVFFLAPLFDFAGPADIGGCNEYPYYGQLKLTLRHPEWMPIDRYGVRSQNGPIELAYPEARKGLIDMYLHYIDRDKFDGISLFTYCENYGIRFEDEFGYSPPIVDEYKRRYGVDIRTQAFDKNLWRYLRGEYVTQFLRELRIELRARGKKLNIFDINPEEPHFPEPWEGTISAGRVYLDWGRWIREGLVDDFNIKANGPFELQRRTIEDLLQASRGMPVDLGLDLEISSFDRSTAASDPAARLQPFTARGMRLALFGTSDASYLKLTYPDQSAAALEGPDIYAAIRFLSQVAEGQATIDAAKVVPFLRNKNILVRRQALKALGKLKDAGAVPALEGALADPESSVRSAAVFALLDTLGPQSVGKMIDLVRKLRNFQIFEAVSDVLVSVDARDLPDLAGLARDSDPLVRRLSAYVLGRRGIQEGLAVLISRLEDEDLYVRFLAAHGLQLYFGRAEAEEALLRALNDSSPIVQDRAAVSLAIALVEGCTTTPRSGLESVVRTLNTPVGPLREIDLNPAQERALQALVQKFREFGDDSRRTDLEWGFRPVGNAILAFGARGGEELQTMIDQGKDRQLATLAWKVLFLRQGMENYCPVSDAEEENDLINRTRP